MVKKKRHCEITERDYKLLRFLWKWKAVSTQALANKFFPDIKPDSAYRRLQFLEADDYISSFVVEGRFHEVWGLREKGFKYILDGMIAERTMVAGEAIGDGYWFVNRAVKYANERVVFDRPIGKNQGISFPIAQAYAHVRAADLMRFDAAQKFDAGIPAGTEANLAKHLAAEASWEAADVAMQTLGGYGVAEEYDVERKFRETRLFRIAPLSTNLILSYIAEHVLGLPRSY